MLTMPQIIHKVDPRRRESANYVRLIYQKRGWRKEDGRGFVACKSYSTKEWDPYKQRYVPNPRIKNRYVTAIVFLDARLHVDVGCSCPDFRYRQEYALNRKRAAEITYSNGEAAPIRNPRNKVYCCKHLYRLWTIILPEIPKVPRGARSDDTYAPTVKVPPSILRKQQEEQMKKINPQNKPPEAFTPTKNANSPATKGLQSPGMSNWIFGG